MSDFLIELVCGIIEGVLESLFDGVGMKRPKYPKK